MELRSLGWDDGRQKAFDEIAEGPCVPGRVVRVERGVAHVVTDDQRLEAILTGRVLDPERGGGTPVVGDWVAVEPGGPGASPVVRALLPRRTRFARQAPGRASGEQVLVANLDTLFVVVGLDGDFNPRRIERYLALSTAGGVDPVVVLNKADLCADLESRLGATRAVAPGVPVAVISAGQGTGVDSLEPWLSPGVTVALVGSSGVGKSTLVNRLLGEERLQVGEVRGSDGRGRHTTTRRELFRLEGGALCIDTPGLRELQLSVGEEEVDEAFPEIEELGLECRFRDCDHDGEPGCAVAQAIADDRLASSRLDSWRRLRREAAHHERRLDEHASRAEARRQGRAYKRIQSEKGDRRR